MQLREYQQQAVDDLWQWFQDGNEGNPCLVMPTGSGKSHVVARICQDAVEAWPGTRILMLTHNKELVEQNFEKLLDHWPNAPCGICCASMGKSDLGEPVTFATVGSVSRKVSRLGHVDLVIVDEAHGINHKADGGYRDLFAELSEINPSMRVIGLTATPYRLGHGLITDEPAIFQALIEPVTIKWLVDNGYLSPLKSKMTGKRLSTAGVGRRGGEYIHKDLAKAVDIESDNEVIANEVISHGVGCRSWLLFCAGVDHAHHMAEKLISKGIVASAVTGDMTKGDREKVLGDFKEGRIQALTNCQVLTTGFDHPGIDLIAMLRPTESPGLYVQMAGRGLRICAGKQNCKVLDFGGVVSRHGPITDVQPPKRKGEGEPEDAPVKECPECSEIIQASIMTCPECGFMFPPPDKEAPRLRDDDIMGMESSYMEVTGWRWAKHISQKSGLEMILCSYYGALSDPTIKEYLTVVHGGFAGMKARRTLETIAEKCGADMSQFDADSTLDELAIVMSQQKPPSEIEYRKDGKFYRIIERTWNHDERRVHDESGRSQEVSYAGAADSSPVLRDMRMAQSRGAV
jgi:DNA repair protein RadD